MQILTCACQRGKLPRAPGKAASVTDAGTPQALVPFRRATAWLLAFAALLTTQGGFLLGPQYVDCSPTGNCEQPYLFTVGWEFVELVGRILPSSVVVATAYALAQDSMRLRTRWDGFLAGLVGGWPVAAVFTYAFDERTVPGALLVSTCSLALATMVFLSGWLLAAVASSAWAILPRVGRRLAPDERFRLWIFAASLLHIGISLLDGDFGPEAGRIDTGLSLMKKWKIGGVSIDWILVGAFSLASLASLASMLPRKIRGRTRRP